MVRKQLSMVLPDDLLAAIKQQAAEQGLTVTAYLTGLVRRDLGWSVAGSRDPEMLDRLDQLEARLDVLERRGSSQS